VDIETIEREREARKAALLEARTAQRAIDLEALNALEIERGDENVAAINVDRFSFGLVTLVVVRPLTKHELKRFRDRTKKEGSDASAAAEEAAESTVLYPAKDSDAWKALLDAVPGMAVRAGVAAVKLAAGVEQAEGK